MRNRESYNAYMRQYKRRNYKEIRDTAIAMLGGKCARCGSVEGLEIDHIDRSTKEIEVGRIHSVSRERFLAEVKKCQLLCKTCHIEKTLSEQGLQSAKEIHGTLASYRYCKCDICREAKNAHHREYMRKRRAAK